MIQCNGLGYSPLQYSLPALDKKNKNKAEWAERAY